MGIIQRQSIRSSVFIILGFAIGAFNIIVLFPKFLSPEEFGLTRAMLDISVTLSLLCTLGAVPVIYKFYPFYSYYLADKKDDLPMITGLVCLTGFMVIMVTGYVFEDFIIRKLGKSPQLADYFYTIYPFTFFMLAFAWLESFSWGLKKTVITNFLKETGVRIIGTILILLYGFQFITLPQFIVLFSLSYLVPVLVLLYILLRTGKWKFSFTGISSVTRRLGRRMVSFGLYIFGAQFFFVLSKTNDTFLIFGIKGLAETAVFAVASYAITVLEIPQRSLAAISTPVLAESWKNNDLSNIDHVYKKSVSNLLLIGLGLFGLIFLNIHNLAAFLGAGYENIELIVFIMGMAKVLDLGTGINSIIIGTSNFWKFDFYTNITYTIFSIPLNFILIKAYGLEGLAFSMLISMTIYNAIRYIFLYRKFGLQPYNFRLLLAILIAIGMYLIIYMIPRFSNIYLDTLIRTLAFVIIFVPVMYKMKIAPDLNSILDKTLNRIFKR